MAEVATRNKFEQIKAERDGIEIGADIVRFAREGWESISEADRDVRLKWWGVFYRKQTPGHFMVRIRIPNGLSSAAQVRTIGEIARTYGRNTLDVTTRQQVQLRWIRIEDMPAVIERLRDAGLVTLQTGLDNIRGIAGCAVAGLTPDELFDASPVVQAFNRRLVGNPQFTNLPRKFNVAISGCRENCTHAATQDLAMVPALKEIDGLQVEGFNVLAGGKMGSGGFTPARPLDVFVAPRDAAELAAAVALVFRDHGHREARTRARLSFLLDEWGIERFRAEVEARAGFPLASAGKDMRCEHTTDHIGVHAQRQAGLNYVGLVVPLGRATGEQLVELARAAEAHGSGEIRFTTGQNVIVAGVPDDSLGAFLDEPLLHELSYQPSAITRGSVSCTGMDYCSMALIETKGYAAQIIADIEAAMGCMLPVTVNWSGCPAGCGNHQVSDIGLLGRRTRIGNEVVDTVDIYIGGCGGPDPVAGVKFMQDVPCRDLGSTIEFLIRHVDFHEVRRKLRAGRMTTVAVAAAA